jgi:hypothetical protein
VNVVNVNQLAPVETLNLGRLHVGVKVSPDTVVFAFGSGRPSTNGVLAYNLEKDEFFRPALSGPLPTPRFTAASVMVEKDGYLFVHGGYSSQYGGSVSDMCILDCAPALRRDFSTYTVDPNPVPNEPVTDEELVPERSNGNDFIIRTLMQSSEEERQATANSMLQHLRGVVGADPRHLMLLNLFANGRVQFAGEDDDDEGEGDDDEDEEEGEDEDYVEY